MDETTRMLSDIRERVVRVETKLDNMNDIQAVAREALNAANHADSSARSAHLRLNRIDKIIFWASTTVIGAVIVGLIAFYVKNGGSVAQ